MLKQHERKANLEVHDVYTFAMQMYSKHLTDIESKDMNMLKKSIADMKRLKEELLRDLEYEQTNEINLMK